MEPQATEFELVIGSDNVIRINVNGRLVSRCKLAGGCLIKIRLADGTELIKLVEE